MICIHLLKNQHNKAKKERWIKNCFQVFLSISNWYSGSSHSFSGGNEEWNQNFSKFHLPTGPHSPQGRRDSVMTSTKLKDTTKMSRTFQYISYKKQSGRSLVGGGGWTTPLGKICSSCLSGGWTSSFQKVVFFVLISLAWICTPTDRDEDHNIFLSHSDSSFWIWTIQVVPNMTTSKWILFVINHSSCSILDSQAPCQIYQQEKHSTFIKKIHIPSRYGVFLLACPFCQAQMDAWVPSTHVELLIADKVDQAIGGPTERQIWEEG